MGSWHYSNLKMWNFRHWDWECPGDIDTGGVSVHRVMFPHIQSIAYIQCARCKASFLSYMTYADPNTLLLSETSRNYPILAFSAFSWSPSSVSFPLSLTCTASFKGSLSAASDHESLSRPSRCPFKRCQLLYWSSLLSGAIFALTLWEGRPGRTCDQA